jgi:hypothetical protein
MGMKCDIPVIDAGVIEVSNAASPHYWTVHKGNTTDPATIQQQFCVKSSL